MISPQQQEEASLYILGALPASRQSAFEEKLRTDRELRSFVFQLQRAARRLVESGDQNQPPSELREKLFDRVGLPPEPSATPRLSFQERATESGWKRLPMPGAYIKLLSLEVERGYAVLLGRIDAGVRYPAHVNAGPEDFYILTGDLVVGERKLSAGDFHHADKGSVHEVNYSLEGCILLAVLTTDDPLVRMALT